MAGNEVVVCQFLLENLGNISLKHLGKIVEIAAPNKKSSGFSAIASKTELKQVITQDSKKKADIYINGIGVSIKQSGGSFSFNRIQRANIVSLYQQLQFKDIPDKLDQLDLLVGKYHQGLLTSRDVPWTGLFDQAEFYKLLKFLMMQGSPNHEISQHPATYILEAPKKNISQHSIQVHTFQEYFDLYNDKLFIAIRRQWVGQSSSEHSRALGLSKKPDNKPWVFDEVVGEPKIHKDKGTRWRDDFPPDKRKTVYFLMIEKKK